MSLAYFEELCRVGDIHSGRFWLEPPPRGGIDLRPAGESLHTNLPLLRLEIL